MTAKDLKIEIQKVLDKVPDDLLEDVLSYLQEVQKRSASDFNNSQHLKKILTEDSELLKKLAQ
ncbi:hypothetical protein I2I11_13510 [Pontibacter sp. 172403-2]|uniref:hypothetical protein n=1 Tax=Pontibacter rufus TaxID=2791028 RepID=UPI0018AF9B5D|nr:hypothetical protein [Pontibacter sp. 172403-2]MBF9254317.1 hypothetical protein [Pontibacter sp. 172403-2]